MVVAGVDHRTTSVEAAVKLMLLDSGAASSLLEKLMPASEPKHREDTRLRRAHKAGAAPGATRTADGREMARNGQGAPAKERRTATGARRLGPAARRPCARLVAVLSSHTAAIPAELRRRLPPVSAI